MVSGTVPPGLFLFSFFFGSSCFDPLLAREEGRVGLFILGSPPQQRFVDTGPATQLCTTACLSWDRPPSVAPAAQPKTETTTGGGQPKHPKGTTNNGDPKGRGRQPANATLEPNALELEPKWLLILRGNEGAGSTGDGIPPRGTCQRQALRADYFEAGQPQRALEGTCQLERTDDADL